MCTYGKFVHERQFRTFTGYGRAKVHAITADPGLAFHLPPGRPHGTESLSTFRHPSLSNTAGLPGTWRSRAVAGAKGARPGRGYDIDEEGGIRQERRNRRCCYTFPLRTRPCLRSFCCAHARATAARKRGSARCSRHVGARNNREIRSRAIPISRVDQPY